MRKILFLLGLMLALAVRLPAAEAVTISLTDGGSLAGDIVKFDDNGVLLRATGDVYTNIPWAKFSQASLKQVSSNPKIKALVEPFIEPDVSQRPAKAEIQVQPVKRMERPANPSVFGGLTHSPVGWFILLVVYLANLYAAFEVSVLRARAPIQVIGLAAVLPIIGPAIFLAMPMRVEPQVEEPVNVSGQAPAGTVGAAKPAEDIKIVEASWKQEEKKKVEPVIFARGKFTFNKRFVETKFASYVGAPVGDALKNTMQLKCSQGEFIVERIAQVAANDVIIETVERGQLTVPFADIQEIKLTPRTA